MHVSLGLVERDLAEIMEDAPFTFLTPLLREVQGTEERDKDQTYSSYYKSQHSLGQNSATGILGHII